MAQLSTAFTDKLSISEPFTSTSEALTLDHQGSSFPERCLGRWLQHFGAFELGREPIPEHASHPTKYPSGTIAERIGVVLL